MSFFSGLGGFIGNAITPLNQAMAARNQGQIAGQQRALQNAIQMYAMQKQQEQMNMQRALQNSEINKNASLARSADALANYHNNGGPISVQWYQGDDGSQIPMVTRAPASYFKNGGLASPPTPQGAPIQSTPFAPPTTNDLTTGLRGGPQQPTGQPPQAPTQQPPGVPITTQPRITRKLGAAPPTTRLQQAQGTLEGKDWKGSYNPQTGQYFNLDGTSIPATARFTPYAPPVQPAIVVGQDSTGQHVYRVPKQGGPATEVPGITPRSASGLGGGGSMAPVDDMEQRYGEIQQAAQDLAAGKWRITPAMQTREGLTYAVANASAGGHPDLKDQALGMGMDLFGMGRGGNGGQDFARYQALMNSTRALGDDAAKVFKGRQNEDAVKREIALGELTPDDYQNPTVVTQKLQRLRNVIDLAHKIMPQVQPSRGGGRGGAGMSNAKPVVDPLVQKYNLTPPGDDE